MDKHSERILEIRRKAGNDNTVCPLCGRAPYSPFREYDKQGKVVAGCVDAIHTGRLASPSESNFWHNRLEARAIRKSELDHLMTIKN